MNQQPAHTEPVSSIRARRVSIDCEGNPSVIDEDVGVAVEAPITIDVEGIENYTLLYTPTDTRALALGFLFTEGVIEDLSEVTHLEPCADSPGTIRVRLAGGIPKIGDPNRNLLIVSSCGACGTEDLATRMAALPSVGDTLRITCASFQSARDGLAAKQELFPLCGGTHAAGIFDKSGNLLASAEDAGRHNALDKAIGKCLVAGLPTASRGAVLSGRVSLEMVTKCARAGIELISAISAPTSLAIDVAEQCGITLCAFVRETRATVFTRPHRVIDA